MKASELIKSLQSAIDEHGDLEVIEWNDSSLCYFTVLNIEKCIKKDDYKYLDEEDLNMYDINLSDETPYLNFEWEEHESK